jgi:hypothetical protein
MTARITEPPTETPLYTFRFVRDVASKQHRTVKLWRSNESKRLGRARGVARRHRRAQPAPRSRRSIKLCKSLHALCRTISWRCTDSMIHFPP